MQHINILMVDDHPIIIEGYQNTLIASKKINQEIKQRVTESIETGLKLTDGKILALDMETEETRLFSSKFACPHCDYAIPELEPRLFSFNNPMGACPDCDGLGHKSFFDPQKVVALPQLSLASGAIKGWDKRNQFYFQILSSLAKHYNFDLSFSVYSLFFLKFYFLTFCFLFHYKQ